MEQEQNCEGGLCRYCDKPAVVGLNGAWVCLDHFQEGLRAVRRFADLGKSILEARGGQ